MLRCIITDGEREFGANDFGRSINLKIYDENDAAFDFSATGPLGALSAYVVLEYDDMFTKAVADIVPSSTTPASGVVVFNFTSTNCPVAPGYYYLKVELRTPAQGTAPTIRVSTFPARITFLKQGWTSN